MSKRSRDERRNRLNAAGREQREKRPTPESIFKEVESGRTYKQDIDLYETVRKNEDFYTGDQWRGLAQRTPNILLVQLNFLQRVCSMFISKVVSDDIAVNLTPLREQEGEDAIMRTLSHEVDNVYELIDMKRQNRSHVRDAVVDGDTACYMWFDPDAPTGQYTTGAIRSEIVENTNIIFGNPYDSSVERQPYIIVLQRKPVKEVREDARDNGMQDYRIEEIEPDIDTNKDEKGSENDLVTVATRLWKDKRTGHVFSCRSTEKVIVEETRDLLLTRYPVAWMSWEKIRSSYHGRAAITGLIPNQIALNTTYSAIVTQIRNTAFPKLIYNKTMIDKWDPSPATAIEVIGNIDVQKIAGYLEGASVNPSVTNVMDSLLTLTRDCMGVSDASLGNVRPDNYSAIVALQNADNYPIELHRQEFYSFAEQQVRIIIDMMRAYYGERDISVEQNDPVTNEPKQVLQPFDFSQLTDENVKIRVDIGASTYWSETMQVETLNNIFTSGVMNDPESFELFLECMPDKYIAHKQKLIEFAKQREQQAQMQAGTMPPVM